jgi:DNA helicase-2/ATP-dependent DNA helicase PcrA
MDQKTELAYLEKVKSEIEKQINELAESTYRKKKEIVEMRQDLWQNIYEMDPAEIAHNNQMIDTEVIYVHGRKLVLRKLEKMQSAPYFARIDFSRNQHVEPYYIGLGHLEEKENYKFLVYDWRAPVSSLFYDYGIGPAEYKAPKGRITGEITSKIQYKIKNGEMQYMFDTSVTVNDDILQKELSQNTSKKLRNIVSSIQAEQNRIIRANRDQTLIVQGVAGSGKTSIALHRVAFLLYKYKETLKSNNILIVSPSKVFSTYISDVLPELGEENIVELSLEDIAINELGKISSFEKKLQHIDAMLQNIDSLSEDEIDSRRYKASLEFAGHMAQFVEELAPRLFMPISFEYKGCVVDKKKLDALYNTNYVRQAPAIRVEYILEYLYETIQDAGIKLSQADKQLVKQQLMEMFKLPNLLEIYTEMLRSLRDKGYLELVKPRLLNCIEYEDVYPIILLKYYLHGVPSFHFAKHLVIDEMQDYTPVQYEILNKLFPCSKTILGDVMQMVDPYSNIGCLDNLQAIYGNSQVLKLMTSYRSSAEITNFAKSIVEDNEIKALERHDDKPTIVAGANVRVICQQILADIQSYQQQGYGSIAILCKTLAEARDVYQHLQQDSQVALLAESEEVYKTGVIVTTSFIAKGLEFDCVIVPQVNSDNYCHDFHRQSLYVSCTRALHQLKLYYSGNISHFLYKAINQSLVRQQ